MQSPPKAPAPQQAPARRTLSLSLSPPHFPPLPFQRPPAEAVHKPTLLASPSPASLSVHLLLLLVRCLLLLLCCCCCRRLFSSLARLLLLACSPLQPNPSRLPLTTTNAPLLPRQPRPPTTGKEEDDDDFATPSRWSNPLLPSRRRFALSRPLTDKLLCRQARRHEFAGPE